MSQEKKEKLKMLIVEDELMLRMIMQDILSPLGSCDIAVNGEESLEAFRVAWRNKDPYDLICMDIMMPVLDGQEALLKIREVEKVLGITGSEEVKVIMTTAMDDPKNVVHAYSKGGATSYIVKPIDKEHLINEIRTIGLIA